MKKLLWDFMLLRGGDKVYYACVLGMMIFINLIPWIATDDISTTCRIATAVFMIPITMLLGVCLYYGVSGEARTNRRAETMRSFEEEYEDLFG